MASKVNTVLRRVVLCLVILPCLLGARAACVVLVGPMVLFIEWVSGAKHPLRAAREVMATERPMATFDKLWKGEG